MSLFTILCFTTLLYFSVADPVPSGQQPLTPVQAHAQLELILAQINEIIENGLPSITSALTPEDQEYLIYSTEECIKGCLNEVEGRIRTRDMELTNWAKNFDTESY